MEAYVLKTEEKFLNYIFEDNYMEEGVLLVDLDTATIFEDLNDALNLKESIEKEDVRIFLPREEQLKKIKNLHIVKIKIEELEVIKHAKTDEQS